jgi:hypothetical protein
MLKKFLFQLEKIFFDFPNLLPFFCVYVNVRTEREGVMEYAGGV